MEQTKFANFHCSAPIITVSVFCSFQVKFNSGSLYGEHFEKQIFKQGFEMCLDLRKKVWILCDQNLDPGGGQLMRSNPDYSRLKGWCHEGPRMEAQGFDN